MVIYFTRYIHSKSIKMLSLYYYELMGKIKEHGGKKYLYTTDVWKNISFLISNLFCLTLFSIFPYFASKVVYQAVYFNIEFFGTHVLKNICFSSKHLFYACLDFTAIRYLIETFIVVFFVCIYNDSYEVLS